MKALFLTHPKGQIRDTQTYQPFRDLMKTRRPGLKKLTARVLDVQVQTGEHSSVSDRRARHRSHSIRRVFASIVPCLFTWCGLCCSSLFCVLAQVQDAQAAMRLYTMHKKEWERSLKLKKSASSIDKKQTTQSDQATTDKSLNRKRKVSRNDKHRKKNKRLKMENPLDSKF